MRASFAALGIKLGLAEAKSLIARQTGDRAGVLRSSSNAVFDYKEFLRAYGADVPRAEAAAQRFATDADQSNIDIHNPPPQPSAASLIIERLRRERGSGAVAGEGYIVAADEHVRQKQVVDTTIAKSEIDKVGGLSVYLSDEHVETSPGPGYLPRLPGHEHARRAVDDSIFRKGEFTNAVMAEGGIGKWNEVEDKSNMPEGYHALPGQQPHKRIHDDLHFGGELKKVGGIAELGDDTETGKTAPEGYTYVFPHDSFPRRISSFPSQHMGELTSRGGLLAYLADMKTDLSTLGDDFLPLAPGEKYAKKKSADPLHHGGELLAKGIGGYIGDNSGAGVEGYIQSVTGYNAKKAVVEEAFLHGSLESSGAAARMFGPARPGMLAAVDDDDIPVLPEDMMINPDATEAAVRRARAQPSNKDVAALLGPASEIDTTGGLSSFLASNDPKVRAPVAIVNSTARQVGHISKAGGLGGYIGKAVEAAAPDGYVAPLPGQDWAHQKDRTPEKSKGQIDRMGGLGGFLTNGGAVGEVPEGYVEALTGGLLPKKKGDLDLALIGTLDKFGGLAGFYSSEVAKSTPADGYLPALPGQEFGHKIETAQGRRGKIEEFGLGGFMFSSQALPEGYVAPLPGQNDDAPRQVLSGGEHNKGVLEKNGGITGWLQNAADAEDGYVLYPGEGMKRKKADPLHHYSTIGAERGTAFNLDIGKNSGVNPAGIEHIREGQKMVGGRLVTRLSVKEPEVSDHVRNEVHMRKSRVVETTHDGVEISAHVREEHIVGGHVGARKDEANLKQAVIERETSLLAVEADRKEFARKLRLEAEAETMARQGPPMADVYVAGSPAVGYGYPASSASAPAAQAQAQAAAPSGPSSVAGGSVSGSLYSHARSVATEQANQALRKMQSGPTTHNGTLSPGSYARRHTKVGSASPQTVSLVASSPAVQLDVRRLARVRKAIRDVLPKKGGSAAALLRQRLHKEDGDSDGVVSDVELLRGLTTLNPGLTSSDIGFIVKYMRAKARHTDEELLPEGFKGQGSTTGGLAHGIDVDAVAEWVTRQPGGIEGGRYTRGADGEEGGEGGSGAGADSGAQVPVVANDRITWNSRAQKIVAFRAHWEERHGAPAQKEMAADAAAGSEGPTWTRADPQPFKVLHVAGGPPRPMTA
jgi:hypothetical protein